MNDIIYNLCKKYTDLTDEDIQIISALEPALQSISNIENADIFIDCPTKDISKSIVVAQAKPHNVPSAYKKSVIGMMAKGEHEPAVARSFQLNIATKHVKATTQENTNVVQTVEPIRNGKKTIGVLISEKNTNITSNSSIDKISNNNNYEKITNVLSSLAHENNWLTQYIDEAIIMVDKKGVVCFRNSLAKKLYQRLGYIEDILGMKYENILLHHTEVNNTQDNKFVGVEVNIGKHFLNVKQILLNKNGISFAVIIKDITQMREKEKELILKSVAIKEMHHRIKNNLQTVGSLLRLQSRRVDAETKKVLDETISRILSISTTYEILARVGEDKVNILEVLKNIKRTSIRYFVNPAITVEININGDDFKVDSDVATSVALVFNEILQNSLHYAFSSSTKGQINVVVKNGELYSQIEISDDGIGFDVEEVSQTSLGLSIVKAIVQDKLGGNLLIESSEQGTKVSFDFKNEIITDAT